MLLIFFSDEIDDDDDDAAEIIQCHLDVIDEEMAEIESQLQTLCERQDQLKNQKELLLKQMESKTAAIARSKVSKDDFNGFREYVSSKDHTLK